MRKSFHCLKKKYVEASVLPITRLLQEETSCSTGVNVTCAPSAPPRSNIPPTHRHQMVVSTRGRTSTDRGRNVWNVGCIYPSQQVGLISVVLPTVGGDSVIRSVTYCCTANNDTNRLASYQRWPPLTCGQMWHGMKREMHLLQIWNKLRKNIPRRNRRVFMYKHFPFVRDKKKRRRLKE